MFNKDILKLWTLMILVYIFSVLNFGPGKGLVLSSLRM